MSEVAEFRKREALCEEAAQRGMSGFAISATHASITARMERGAERILRLIEAGRHEDAMALLNTDWYAEDCLVDAGTPACATIDKQEREGVV
jgi:hypothetical protein